MKAFKKLFAILIIAVLTFSLFSCDINIGTSYNNSDKYTAGGASLSGVERIDIDWISGSVNIAAHDSDAVTFSEVSDGELTDGERLHYYLDGTTLRIKPAASGTRTIGFPEKELTVLVPADVRLSCIEVEAASADISFTGGSSARVNAETASGRIVLDGIDVSYGSVDAESASGDVELTIPAECSSVEVDTASGEIDIDCAGGPGDMSLESASGDVTVRLPSDAAFVLECDTASGDVQLDFEAVVRDDEYIVGDREVHYEIETASGDIKVLKK